MSKNNMIFTPQGIPDNLSEYIVYACNVAYEMTDDQIVEFFSKAFPIMKMDYVIGHDGPRKGHVRISYSTKEAAENAILSLNGNYLSGRKIKVDWDMPTMIKLSRETISQKNSARISRERELNPKKMNRRIYINTNHSPYQSTFAKMPSIDRVNPYAKLYSDNQGELELILE